MTFKVCCIHCPHQSECSKDHHKDGTYERLICDQCGTRNPAIFDMEIKEEFSGDRFQDKFNNYKDDGFIKRVLQWLTENLSKVKQLLEETPLSKFVLEPFYGVFDSSPDIVRSDVYNIITKVAIINAVLAGLPGKMVVGVYVAMALELWMAVRIAQYVGLKDIRNASDIARYIGLLASTGLIILEGFKMIIGSLYSVVSLVVPIINPLIVLEIIATNLIGLIFLFGFKNVLYAKKFGDIRYLTLLSMTKDLSLHQFYFLKNVVNTDNIKTVGARLKAFLMGDFPVDPKIVNGEVFSTIAMAYLIAGQHEKLEGPLGEAFIQAIRLRWSAQLGETATMQEISEHFQQYDMSQLEGVTNTIKGKMFEILVTAQENTDSDNWIAKMHEDESFPGSDIIFFNSESNETLEVSLKAVSADNSFIIEDALIKYPDLPIMTTDEAASHYANNPNVYGSGFTNTDLDDITDQNLKILISQMEPINTKEVVVGGVTVSTFAALWPFVMAYLRNRLTQDQLEKVFFQVMGDSGIRLVSRLVSAAVLGPIFAWWLLAKGVGAIVDMASPEIAKPQKITKLSFSPA
jgi:hypothetical protein